MMMQPLASALKKALPWDPIKTAPYKPEGKFTSDTLAYSRNQQSKVRQQKNPQFTYLSNMNDIRNMEDEKKPVRLDVDSQPAKNATNRKALARSRE